MSYLRFLSANWRWLLAGFVLSLTSSYGQTYFISVFAGEIRDEFGLSHGAWGGIYSLATTASALVMIWAGGVTDHFRVRVLAPTILVGLALACLLMSAASSIVMLGFAIFALRFTGQGMTAHIAATGASRWFVAGRGKALAIMTLGFAVGQALFPIVFVELMTRHDWRTLWRLAALLAVVLIPLIAFLLLKERTPQSFATSNSAMGMDGRHWRRGDVVRGGLFWAIAPLAIGPSAWGTALFFQQVHLTEIKGWLLADFVALYPALTIATIAATFATGWAVDRFGAGAVLCVMPLPHALGQATIGATAELSVAGAGLIVVGIGMGMQATVITAFWAEYYGTRHIGSIKAAASALTVFGSAIGPGVSGILIDLGIDFGTQMIGYGLYFLLSAALAVAAIRRARIRLPRTPQVDVVGT